MGGAGGEGGVLQQFSGGPEEGDQLEAPGSDYRIILTWIYKMFDGDIWIGLSWLRVGTGGLHL
jgi:hypothetical protein